MTAAAVVGGGALGLAAALRLAQSGYRITLFERETQLGGLAAGIPVGQSSLEKFYHHIFRTDRTIVHFIRELGLSDVLEWKQPQTSVYWNGEIAGLDSALDVLRFPFLPPIDRLRLAAGVTILKCVPNERPFAGVTAATWLSRVMGKRVFQVVWEPLLRGKFGGRSEDIAMSWFWSRIHERTASLGYMRGGFQCLYDSIGERIRALGGTLLLGTSVTSIRGTSGTVEIETDAGHSDRFDQVLVTLPTRLFMQLTTELPDAYRRSYDGPEYYGSHVVVLALDRALTDGIYWLNINEPGFPFLALVEHTHLMPASDYGGRHLVYLGNYLPMNHQLYSQTDAQILSQFYPAIRRIRPDFDLAWVKEHWVFRAPYAQPIVTLDYTKHLPPHQTPIPGVFLANMGHVYPQDRGQNYSLLLGERMARLMRDARH